jgi:hypothetical protein
MVVSDTVRHLVCLHARDRLLTHTMLPVYDTSILFDP